jgi:hypothetical protein
MVCSTLNFTFVLDSILGAAVAQLVEALRYQPTGRGFDFFIGIILSVTLWPWGLLSL